MKAAAQEEKRFEGVPVGDVRWVGGADAVKRREGAKGANIDRICKTSKGNYKQNEEATQQANHEKTYHAVGSVSRE